MSPAGSRAALAAAVRAGAGAVYFGIDRLNMRARAARPFALDDLRRVARICRRCGVRSYLTLNTIMYDEDLADMRAVCAEAARCGITAVIATDIAAIRYARDIGLEVHISVQANISNIETVAFYAQYADVMVLARELSLDQVRYICDQIRRRNLCGPAGKPVRIELFVHGALCVAVSGRCYMSLAQYNASANRGACLQPCRRRYRVMDDETGEELTVDNRFVMSPRDLCLIGHLDRILESGVSVLKIEGRGRTADYVETVTRVYRQAVQAVAQGTYTTERIEHWRGELRNVFNRGFWEGGYYCGDPLDMWSAAGHSQAKLQREQLGVVSNYFARPGAVEFKLWKPLLQPGDQLLFEGKTTGAMHHTVAEIRVEGKPVEQARRGDRVTLRVPHKVRRNDKVFLLTERQPQDPGA